MFSHSAIKLFIGSGGILCAFMSFYNACCRPAGCCPVVVAAVVAQYVVVVAVL